MRLVVQRVSRAEVRVDGRAVGRIGPGLVVLVGIGLRDAPGDLRFLAGKVARLRVFPDGHGRMNRDLREADGKVLAISQFTLYGDCTKGNRPGFTGAAPADVAEADCARFVDALRAEGLAVETGVFQADMDVELINQGPVTLLLESEGRA